MAFKSHTNTKLYTTLEFLARISFISLSYHPGRCFEFPEKWASSRSYNLFVWFAFFSQNGMTFKKATKIIKIHCFLGYFQSLFKFGWKNSGPNHLEWVTLLLLTPKGGKIMEISWFLHFFLKFLTCGARYLAFFFIISKVKPNFIVFFVEK